MVTRRKFFQSTAAAIAGASLTAFKSSKIDFSFDSASYSFFDFHTHPGLFVMKGLEGYRGDEGVLKTVSEMRTGKLSGAFFSLVADMTLIKIGPDGVKPVRSYSKGEGWLEYKRQINVLKEFFKTMPISLATKASDLSASKTKEKVAAYIACEGGDFLEGDAGKLDEMYMDGVRSIQLVHYHPNELGNLQTELPQHDGLSKSGVEVVRKMNKLKMVIDLAHASLDTVKAVVNLTDAPVILSHSILEMDSNRPIAKRAISAEHATLIAKTGGVIGAWPSGFNYSFDEFIDNTKRLVDVVGIDHVGLGTDMDGNFKPVFSSYLQLPQWAQALKSKGFSEQEVSKITGDNAQRVLNKIL
jgi:membrane dipeptidase